MLGPGDNMILQFRVDELEHLAVTCDANRDIAVVLGIFPGFEEPLSVGYIELQLADAHADDGLDQYAYPCRPAGAAHQSGIDIYDRRRCPSGACMRHPGKGVQHRGYTIFIAPLRQNKRIEY